MNRIALGGILLGLALISSAAAAEFNAQPHLDRPIIGPQLALQEAQAYCESHVMPIPSFDKSEAWQNYADQVRQRVLSDVVFRGETAKWRDAATKVEWQGTIEAHADYRIKKVRFEALPGVWIPALLYEPTKLEGKMPVFLNVNGHDPLGKAATYKQIRCINMAKRGMLTLNLEWFGMGQLKSSGFNHARINQLDLCGTSGVGLHYLAMKRGIDLLLAHPHADAARVGVSGLSGGGWQTIFISSLDTRVTLTNPVAGYSSFATRARFFSDLGDSEQTPVDLGMTADYNLLTALLAPRAALLTFNAKDQCCFAAGHALPPLLDAARPVYRLFGNENDLRWHVNHLPGSHNFEQDNREALYRVIGDTFFPGDKKYDRHELASDSELKTADELKVELPESNADFHSLALKLAESLPTAAEVPSEPAARQAWMSEARQRLVKVTRAPTYALTAASDHRETVEGIEITHWRLRVGDAWTVPAVEFAPREAKRTTIVLADAGRKTTASQVQALLAGGQRVIAIDPFYWGESKISKHDYLWALMLSTLGDRPLGVQAAQLAAIARWSQSTAASKTPVALLAVGPKASLAALVAAALEPQGIGLATTVGGLTSLKQVLTDDLTVSAQPEYFCFGLLEQFDIPQLIATVGEKRVEVLAK